MEDQVVKKPLPVWIYDDHHGPWGKQEEPKPLPCQGLETDPAKIPLEKWAAQRGLDEKVEVFNKNFPKIIYLNQATHWIAPLRCDLIEVCGKDCDLAKKLYAASFLPHSWNQEGDLREALNKCLPNLKHPKGN